MIQKQDPKGFVVELTSVVKLPLSGVFIFIEYFLFKVSGSNLCGESVSNEDTKRPLPVLEWRRNL